VVAGLLREMPALLAPALLFSARVLAARVGLPPSHLPLEHQVRWHQLVEPLWLVASWNHCLDYQLLGALNPWGD
jgi:hypothetical protein